jgi:hypothetical protein
MESMGSVYLLSSNIYTIKVRWYGEHVGEHMRTQREHSENTLRTKEE